MNNHQIEIRHHASIEETNCHKAAGVMLKKFLIKFRLMSYFVSSATSSSSTNKVTSGMRDHHSAENIPFSSQSFEKEYHYNFSSQIKLRNKENKFRFLQDTEISFAENKKGNQGKLFQYFKFIWI